MVNKMDFKDKISKAKHYIETNARKLDRALFEFEFNYGSPQKVLDILKTYQNKDGGFGKALEPDIRMNESSVLATTVALQYVNELNISKPDKMIEQAIYYLVNEMKHFSEELPIKNFWYNVSVVQNQSPHAPWWDILELKPPLIEDWPNPSVEVINYLLKYSQFVPQSLIDELMSDLQNYLKLKPKLEGFVYYKFLCFKRLIPNVPTEIQKEIFTMIDNTFQNTNLLEEHNFEEIKIQWLITEKSSYLFQNYYEKIVELIENEVNRLGDDGGSHPKWKWGESELWNHVEQEWTGKCTNRLLMTLKHCDLLINNQNNH